MTTLREFLVRLRAVCHLSRSDADLQQELRAHLELATEDEGRHQPTREAARRAATLRAGAIASSMDAIRDQRSFRWFDDLGRDLRHAVRSLVRDPVFAIVALATIAIGVGANTAVFAVLNSVLLEPLAYPDADRLVAIWHSAPGAEGLSTVSGDLRLSSSMYFTYAEQNRTFEHFGVWYADSATVTGLAEPEQVRTVVVSDGTLQALGVQPLLGRWFSTADQEKASAETVLLGYGYWQRRFGGDRAVVGRTIAVDSRPHEIIGVMPRGFNVAGDPADLLLAARFDRSRAILPGFGYRGVGRLRAGASLAEASGDIARLVPIWMRSWPAFGNVNPKVYEAWRIAPALRPLKQDVVGTIGRALWLLMLMLGIVLVIACANVATLLLVRAEGRQQELAVRAALGAGWSRIVRALLVESLVLSVFGGFIGLALADVALRVLATRGPATLPRLDEIAVDGRVFAFNVAISIASGIVFGLVPAWKYVSPRLWPALVSGGRAATEGRERHRIRETLVVVQVALALVLLVTAGLMVRSFRAMRAVEPGFVRPSELQTMRTAIPDSLVSETERVVRLQNDILDRLTSLPGATAAGFASEVAMEGVPFDWDVVEPEGRVYAATEVPPLRLFKAVSPRFFEAMGTRVIAGRDYTWVDLYERRRVVMVSDNLARQFWGSPASAIGKRLRTLDSAPWREVIGVVQDVYENGVDQPPPAIVYWPAAGESFYRSGAPFVTRTLTFVVRSARAGTEGFARETQQAVWAANPSLALVSVGTLKDIYDRSMARTSFTLVMLALAGTMALGLGLVGIYGVVAYAVSRRRREIGIRLALGAQRAELTRLFVGSGLLMTAAGLPIGLVVAALVSRLMSSLLYGISPLDLATYLAVSLTLAATAAGASYFPARRAAGIDPATALRAD